MMRRGLAIAAASIAVLGTASAVAAYGGSPDSSGEPAPSVATGTATVTRRTLVDQEELDGVLGYGETRPLVNAAQGTITAIAAEGATVDRGQTLYEVGGAPIPLLLGERPAYRELAIGVSDGPDVRQLEENLIALGMAKGLFTTAASHFDSATEAAVKRWQKALGVEQTGRLAHGAVVFLPSPVRVGAHKAETGEPAQPGAEIAEVTSTARIVTVDLKATKQGRVKAGDKVEVELPDGTIIAATVADVAKVAETPESDSSQLGGGGDDTPTIAVTITLDDAAAVGELDSAPVDVRITRDRREGVLAVPVTALLALAEGGYGVEVRDGTRTRLVGVEPGLFADGWVEVTPRAGGLAEGDRVVVPS